MDFIGWRIKAMLKAALAEWMRGDIQVTDGAPPASVPGVAFGIAVITVVLPVRLFGMGITVSLVSEVGAGGEGARLLGFIWHGNISFGCFTRFERSGGMNGCLYIFYYIYRIFIFSVCWLYKKYKKPVQSVQMP
jgi:hypothetical protein